jgi:uncharacterized protein YndB with AHSA1/START domain
MTDRNDQNRRIEISVEVPGTPEQVWQAIATGPGISSWFVPHEVDEREGGRVRMDFGGGLMDAAAVTVWEPPRRVHFEGAGDRALAFEWLVEARSGDSCIVRLVCTGFGPGEDWDDEFHGMSEGWPLFLENLRLHLTHFRGQRAQAIIPSDAVPGKPDNVFTELCAALGVAADLRTGDRLDAVAERAPSLAGTVAATTATARTRSYHLVLDSPAAGTALLTAEQAGDMSAVSIWLYLYGDAGRDRDALDSYGSFLSALRERLASR